MNNLITKILLILFVLSGLLNSAIAQAPEGIIYQAEARDDKGNIIAKSTLDVKITILVDDITGIPVWEGYHEVTTNDYGMFVLIIGEGTSTYIFEDIKWAEHLHFLNVQVKESKKKTVWIDMGTTQLLSVPYALHAKTAEKAIIDNVDDADSDPANELQNISIIDHDLTLSDGNTITLPDEIEDADADPENELITGVTLNGNTLEISDAGGTNTVDLNSFSSLWTENGSNIYFNTGNIGIGTDNPEEILHVAGGNVRIGKVTDNDGSTASYGDRLYFSGGDDWPAWDSDNSDPLWMARFNADDNVSELRVGIGDDNWGFDKFVVGTEGYDGEGWNPIMAVLGSGNVGIGTTNPLTRLQIDGNMTFAPTGLSSDESRFIGQSIASQSTFDASMGFGGMEIENLDVAGDDDSEQQIHFWTHDQGVTSERRMTIDINGNVGIGTTSPDKPLHILKGNECFPLKIESNTGSTGIQLTTSTTNASIGTQYTTGNGDQWYNYVMHDYFTFRVQTDNKHVLTLKQSGNVGIGTINPLTRLQVNGNMTFAPAGLSSDESRFIGQSIASQSTFDANMGFGGMEIENLDVDGDDDSEQQIHFWTHDQGITSERRMTIDINGNVGIGTTTPAEKLHLYSDENTRIKFNAGGRNAHIGYNAGQFEIGTEDQDEVQIITDGQVRMYFEAFGNVGIGTTTPDEKLHIAGNMRLDGTFEDKDGETGSAGQILSSTGTGTEWIAAPDGGDFSNGGEAVGADRSLGNTDNYALSFKTDNISRFKIQNDGGIRIDGNLGINTNPDGITSINKSIQLFASEEYSNSILNLSGHNSGTIYLESRRTGFSSETSGKKWTISAGSGSVLDLDKFSVYNPDDGYCFTIRDGGNIGIGFNEPKSKLQVNGGVQIANDGDAANADKVGTLRYRADSNNSYIEMCMQTGASSYAWVVIKQNTW